MSKINISKKVEKLKNIIKINKAAIVCIVIVIMSVVSIIIQKNDRKQAMIANGVAIESKENKIAVYITGQVKNPGVYYLDTNSRLDAAIDIAGGITQDADISKVNLSKKLIDSDKIVIPQKQLVQEDENQSGSTSQNNDDTGNVENIENIENSENMATDKVNINEATKEELMTLKGIGEATADKVIEYRKNQKFEKIEDIMNVKGIGQSKYEKIKNNICI